MRKIAITQRLIQHETYHEVRDTLDVKWAELCSELNYLPILLPVNYDFKKYFYEFDISAVILTGGNDLSSVYDNELSRKRDSFEKELIRFSLDGNIPILGVCRGMQVIGEFFGCTLKKVSNHAGTKHTLTISEKTSFKNELEKLFMVNSYHNYALDNISGDIETSALSSDGVVEAIEHKKYKIFCHMWHPERENPFSKEEFDIIRRLFTL